MEGFFVCLFSNTFQLLSRSLTEFSSEAHAVSLSAIHPHFRVQNVSHEYLTLNAELKPKHFKKMHQDFLDASFVSEKQNLTLLVFVLEAGHLGTRLSHGAYSLTILK